ncbi:hypothetical protein ACWD4P_13990 [Kitasatospora sp. NPDC002543]
MSVEAFGERVDAVVRQVQQGARASAYTSTIFELFTAEVGTPSIKTVRVFVLPWYGAADKLSVPGATDVQFFDPQAALSLPAEDHVRRIVTRYRLGIQEWNRVRGVR